MPTRPEIQQVLRHLTRSCCRRPSMPESWWPSTLNDLTCYDLVCSRNGFEMLWVWFPRFPKCFEIRDSFHVPSIFSIFFPHANSKAPLWSNWWGPSASAQKRSAWITRVVIDVPLQAAAWWLAASHSPRRSLWEHLLLVDCLSMTLKRAIVVVFGRHFQRGHRLSLFLEDPSTSCKGSPLRSRRSFKTNRRLSMSKRVEQPVLMKSQTAHQNQGIQSTSPAATPLFSGFWGP